ncbi:MAG: hypothetical protein AMXMBFR84_09710 [Candidatus Hydrogenedentota bacterium]
MVDAVSSTSLTKGCGFEYHIVTLDCEERFAKRRTLDMDAGAFLGEVGYTLFLWILNWVLAALGAAGISLPF